MRKIHSINEIKLHRTNLKHELRYHEDNLRLETNKIVSAYKLFLTNALLEKGIHSIITYFVKQKQQKE
ncbi:MAG: hypothetical protein AB7U05_00340 [Mangrovibacterium sp.]